MRHLFILAIIVFWPFAALGQSQFRTVATVDGAAITAFEVDQRTRFLRFVRTPGAGPDLAREQLIEDALKLAAARRLGLELTPDGLERGMEEFAGRADQELDEFLQTLRAEGIEESTLREFVRVGLTWREVVRTRFGSRAQVSEDEIDRAVGDENGQAAIRVLLIEIILPARPIPGEREEAAAQAERLKEIRSISAFQEEARVLSASPSRERSGRLDWLNLSDLPRGISSVLLGLSRGEVTEPIELENALLLFQLRDIEEIAAPQEAATSAIDYAALYLPGALDGSARGEALRIRGQIDTCDDLYGVAQSKPPEALERGAKVTADIPQDIAIELAKLDAGEISTSLTRANGQTLVFLMLCSRVPTLDDDSDREAIRSRLRARRLAGFADGFLAELRAQAVIIEG